MKYTGLLVFSVVFVLMCGVTLASDGSTKIKRHKYRSTSTTEVADSNSTAEVGEADEADEVEETDKSDDAPKLTKEGGSGGSPKVTLKTEKEMTVTKTSVERKVKDAILLVSKVLKDKPDVSIFSEEECAVLEGVLPRLKQAKTWLTGYSKWKKVISPDVFYDWCVRFDYVCTNVSAVFSDIDEGKIDSDTHQHIQDILDALEDIAEDEETVSLQINDAITYNEKVQLLQQARKYIVDTMVTLKKMHQQLDTQFVHARNLGRSEAPALGKQMQLLVAYYNVFELELAEIDNACVYDQLQPHSYEKIRELANNIMDWCDRSCAACKAGQAPNGPYKWEWVKDKTTVETYIPGVGRATTTVIEH